jgi:hypothetical protein
MMPLFRPTWLDNGGFSPRRVDEPASFCRRYPPHVWHSAEGAMKPLFRPTRLDDGFRVL